MYRLKSRHPLGHLSEYRKDPLSFLRTQLAKGEDVVHYRFGHRQMYLVLNPSYIKEVLVTKQSSFHKSKPFKELDPLLGNGLLLSEDDFHKEQRKFMQPSFTPRHIEHYAIDMGKATQEFIKEWKAREERDISKDMMELTLKIIAKTMFSSDIGDNIYDRVGKHLDQSIDIATKRIRSIIKTPRTWKTRENLAAEQSVEALNQIVNDIIDQRETNPTDSQDLLGVLMNTEDDNGEKMSKQQLRDEVMTIFLAGHETTATALTWAIYHLTQHPNILMKVREEVDEACQGEVPTLEETSKLIYTKKVLSETMRITPPVWLFGRLAMEDVTIGSTPLKKGSTIMISPYLLHRHPTYIKHPEQFNPERFEKGKLSHVPDYVYVPFGSGNRVCIGNHFAMLEMTIVLAALLKNFTFSSTSTQREMQPDPLITFRMKDRLQLIVERR